MSNNIFSVVDKVVLVTGAARGIGLDCARTLAKAGAKVILTDVLADIAEHASKELTEKGYQVLFRKLDVTSEDDWNSAIDAAIESFGGLDALVNNAGIEIAKPLLDITLEEWRRVQTINVEGVFIGTRKAIAAMVPGGASGRGGSIINMSSTAGLMGVAGFTAYCASKGAVRMFSKSVAVEYGRMNIRVNSIHPGLIKTEMGNKAIQDISNVAFGGDFEAGSNFIKNMTPLGCLGETRDIAAAVLYLASDASRFITGTEFVIDGGFVAQ